MTRILFYSTEPILAEGWRSVLSSSEAFELLPSCTDICDLKDRIVHEAPDLVLIDFSPKVTGGVLNEMSALMTSSIFVLWVNSVSTETAFHAVNLGVRGILQKSLPVDLQISCLREVSKGELWIDADLTQKLLRGRRLTLTPREGQMISLISQGLKNKEIAVLLNIGEGSVKVYLSRLFQKVGVKDRFELALFGMKNLSAGQLLCETTGRRSSHRKSDVAALFGEPLISGRSSGAPDRQRHPMPTLQNWVAHP